MYNCMKLWVLALTTAQTSDLVLLVHPLVQLISGVIRLSNNIKYFPFHVKAFEMLTIINQRTGQFVPAAQYFLQVFDPLHFNYFNAKPKKLEDKAIPETYVCLKISKHHIDTQDMKDRLVKESLNALTHFVAANANSASLPEMMVPISFTLRKFKKNVKNQNYRKTVAAFLDLAQKNVDRVIEQRRKTLLGTSLSETGVLTQSFQSSLAAESLPQAKESAKIHEREVEMLQRKIKI